MERKKENKDSVDGEKVKKEWRLVCEIPGRRQPVSTR